jgi:hypothetical protein
MLSIPALSGKTSLIAPLFLASIMVSGPTQAQPVSCEGLAMLQFG